MSNHICSFIMLLCCRYDLDVMVELNANDMSRGHFQECRNDAFNTICQVLCCAPADGSPCAQEDAAKSGWEVDCHLQHWLRLRHPQLQLQLDLQVGCQWGCMLVLSTTTESVNCTPTELSVHSVYTSRAILGLLKVANAAAS